MLWNILIIYFPNVVGVFMPFFIQVVSADIKDEKQRVWISVIMCFLVAALLNWKQLQYGNLSGAEKSMGLIFVESHVVYKTWFKNSMANALLTGLFEPKVMGDPVTTSDRG